MGRAETRRVLLECKRELFTSQTLGVWNCRMVVGDKQTTARSMTSLRPVGRLPSTYDCSFVRFNNVGLCLCAFCCAPPDTSPPILQRIVRWCINLKNGYHSVGSFDADRKQITNLGLIQIESNHHCLHNLTHNKKVTRKSPRHNLFPITIQLNR